MQDWTIDDNRPKVEKIKSGGFSKILEKKLNKVFKPSTRYDDIFRGIDITFYTNQHGHPITLFLGKRKDNGDIKGERYSRRIKKVEDGKIVESHWDHQGKIN